MNMFAGRGGSNIRSIQDNSGAKIKVCTEYNQIMLLTGPPI